MKRTILFLMTGLFVLSMLSGCAKELTDEEMFAKLGDDKIIAKANEIIAEKEKLSPAETAAAAASAPTDVSEPLSKPTPLLPLAPIDLMGEKLNPFYNTDFPDGYTPFAAKFDTGDPDKNEKPTYLLYLTAQGDVAEIVDFVARLAGFDDETSIESFVNETKKGNGYAIDGTSNGKGMNILCNIKTTSNGADFDQCDDVDGCRLELIALIDKENVPQYRAVFTDNYNLKAFGNMAESLAGSLLPDNFSVTVNTQKPKFTMVNAVHQVNDAAVLIKSMSENLKYDWYDKEGNAIGVSYGRIDSGIKAEENNRIKIDQTLNDSETASRDYTKPDVSLSALGFDFNEKDALCIYENNGYRIAIHKPEWGERKEKSNIEFFYTANGYNFVIWYIDSEKRYTVQVDKGKSIAKYEYFAAENRYDEGYPDKEAVQKLFKKIFTDSEPYQYNEAIDRFNKYFSDTFGMPMEKVYALPLK